MANVFSRGSSNGARNGGRFNRVHCGCQSKDGGSIDSVGFLRRQSYPNGCGESGIPAVCQPLRLNGGGEDEAGGQLCYVGNSDDHREDDGLISLSTNKKVRSLTAILN
jgi:hypothetical protein